MPHVEGVPGAVYSGHPHLQSALVSFVEARDSGALLSVITNDHPDAIIELSDGSDDDEIFVSVPYR